MNLCKDIEAQFSPFVGRSRDDFVFKKGGIGPLRRAHPFLGNS